MYRLIGSRALIPAAGVRVGKDEIREAWRAFDVDFEICGFRNGRSRRRHAARAPTCPGACSLRNRGTGAVIELEGIDHLKWRDSKIYQWTRYFDTALVAALKQGGDGDPTA